MKKLLAAAAALLGLMAAASAIAQSANPSASNNAQPSKKVLFVLTSHDRLGDTGKPTGFYLSEVTHPYKVLTEQGFQVDFISPKGGKAPIDGLDESDPINKAFLENAETRKAIETTRTPESVKAADYAAIFFAGGHGTMWDLPENENLQHLTASIYEAGGVVGAVCHGPAGLVNVKLSDGRYLVAGKQVAAFTNEEEKAVKLEKVVPFLLADKLTERGATHLPAPNFEKQVVVSGRLVTGQNPASATGVGEAIAKLLKEEK
jgi:putative intracellular protease/amidase